MIFIVFLVSLGTIHVILAADEKEKRKQSESRAAAAQTAVPDLTPIGEGKPEDTTGSVWSLLRAIEDHGHGETPGPVEDTTKVPTAAKAPPRDC